MLLVTSNYNEYRLIATVTISRVSDSRLSS